MDLSYYLKTFAALIFVICLIWLISFFLKKLETKKNIFSKNKSRILVEESQLIDNRNKIAIVKIDNKTEHVLLLGTNNILLSSKEVNKDK